MSTKTTKCCQYFISKSYSNYILVYTAMTEKLGVHLHSEFVPNKKQINKHNLHVKQKQSIVHLCKVTALTLTLPSLLQAAISLSLGLMRRHVQPARLVSIWFMSCDGSPVSVLKSIGKSKNVVTTCSRCAP